MARDDSGINRKIYFFFVNVGVEPSGDFTPFDPHDALTTIAGLPFSDDGRYLDLRTEDSVYCLFPDKVGRKKNSYARWAKIRRSGLPQIELHGDMKALEIDEEAGVADTSHIIFFPGNIIGAESNFYAPRATRLALYLRRKAPDDTPKSIIVEPLFRPDVRQRLREFRDVTLLSIGATASLAGDIGDVDAGLGQAFKSTAESANAEIIEITMKHIQPISGTDRLAWVRRLAGRLVGRDAVTEFRVAGPRVDNDKMDQIDLMNDKLMTSKRIVRQKSRTRVVDSGSAYDAIEEAFDELGPSVTQAVADLPREQIE